MQCGITVRNAEIQIVRCTENNSKNTFLNRLYTIALLVIFVSITKLSHPCKTNTDRIPDPRLDDHTHQTVG